MTTAKRRRGHSLHLELPDGPSDSPPTVAAIFLILFDPKAGYTVAWKRSIPDLELTESVEFKSLPSGLHNVEQDLIYFLHDDQYAGISAFRNRSAASEDRNALMLAVGALVPLGDGRLGRAWRHKEGLEDLARRLSENPSDRTPLEEFWERHQLDDENKRPSREGSLDTSTSSPKPTMDRSKSDSSNGGVSPHPRTTSTASGFLPNTSFSSSSHHPALAIPIFLDTFGPLVFPLYRAALLRKRILFLCNAPVAEACQFTYVLSILSTLPSTGANSLPLEPLPVRLQSLFSVGVHDMSVLSHGGRPSSSHEGDRASQSPDPGFGWVACTTDDILAHKPDMWDLLVTLPSDVADSEKGEGRIYPRIKDNQGNRVRATQRDLRRWIALKQSLDRGRKSATRPKSSSTARTTASPSPFTLASTQVIQGSTNNASRSSSSAVNKLVDIAPDPVEPSLDESGPTSSSIDEMTDEIVEPQSWSALAYTSFWWWASAGEKRSDLDEEAGHDHELMGDLISTPGVQAGQNGSHEVAVQDDDGENHEEDQPRMASMTRVEVGIIKYFHRLSSLMLSTLASILDSEDEEGEDDELPPSRERYRDEPSESHNGAEDAPLLSQPSSVPGDLTPVHIKSEDLTTLGLDVYSPADKTFVKELVALYWGREALVTSGRWSGGEGDGWELCGIRVC